MAQFVSQMLKLPLTALVFTMEMFVKTMQGLRRIADQGIDAMMGVASQDFDEEVQTENSQEIDNRHETTQIPTEPKGAAANSLEHTSVTGGTVADERETNVKEDRKMPDT